VLKDEQGDGSSAGANFVYQDLKLKGGTKASKGAETLRRRIKRVRNERWREANGIRRRGKRAAAHRREQLAKELVHEKTLSEALNPNQLAEIFSSGVDTSQISLAGPSDDKDGIPDFPTCVVSRDELEDFLRTEFGHSEFREGQFEAISSVLTGERSLIILPTGSGKSLCYQFPSVFLRKKIIGFHKALTIVVSPLIALMTDQLKLLPKCCRGALIHSNISPTQVSFVHAALARGDLDVLFLAPERLIMYSMKEVLASVNVVCVAVDEAHCLSEWSHSFRPAYLSLSRIINEDIKPRSLLALTATATVQTVDSLCAVLSIHHIVRTDGISQGGSGSVQRDNLELFAKRSPNPVMDLIEFLSRPEMSRVGPMIVYVQYKWQTENVANVLRERGFGAAEPYNAGLTSDERRDVHERFMNNALRFVVATIAFGMGIDKSNLRAVIHLCLPRSVENYVQETGRASRDGQLGHCRCFFNTDDYMRVRNKAVSEAIRKEGVDNLVKLILEKREANQLFFVPESIELVNKGHMSLLLSLLESEGLLACVFQGFPKILKLRFFASTIDELAPIDPFVDVLFRSPAETKQGQRGGVASVDLVSAVLKSDVSPPLFMHKLGQAAKAQKFSIAKSDWGHIVAPRQGYGDKDVPALVERVFTKAIANHHLEMNRLDSSFALMSRIAAQSIDDDRIGHKLIQLYFAAEERFPNGEDLVPSILAGAPEALTRNILREIDNIRNDSVN
jgi:RecQ family ATP-dependent DNA helicase